MRIKGTFFSRESDTTLSQGVGSQFSQIVSGTSYIRHAVGQIATKFCMVIKLDERKILQG